MCRRMEAPETAMMVGMVVEGVQAICYLAVYNLLSHHSESQYYRFIAYLIKVICLFAFVTIPFAEGGVSVYLYR